eukprot:g3021.t1
MVKNSNQPDVEMEREEKEMMGENEKFDCRQCGGSTGCCGSSGRCFSGKCQCHSGFSGLRCEKKSAVEVVDVVGVGDLCSSRRGIVCIEHSRCISGKCRCVGGWSGPSCEVKDSEITIGPGSNSAAFREMSNQGGGIFGSFRHAVDEEQGAAAAVLFGGGAIGILLLVMFVAVAPPIARWVLRKKGYRVVSANEFSNEEIDEDVRAYDYSGDEGIEIGNIFEREEEEFGLGEEGEVDLEKKNEEKLSDNERE